MRTLRLLAMSLACIACLSCSAKPTSQVAPTVLGQESEGQLQVFVHWQDEPLADRQIEVVELGLVKRSDASGFVTFEVPPGTYTLRSYVTSPGPAAYVDAAVTVAAGETENVKVQDCLPCLGPN